MTEQEYISIKNAAEETLFKIPGVHGVGLGGVADRRERFVLA